MAATAERLVPGEVAAAFMSGRPELVTILITQLKSGKRKLDRDVVIGLAEAFADVLGHWKEEERKVTRLELHLKELTDHLSGLNTWQEKMRKLLLDAPKLKEAEDGDGD